MHAVVAALAVALLIPGCSDRTSPPPAAESTRSRRVFEKPPGGPRAVPPHAIRSEGVGPYLLGMPLKDVLGLTSRGPSVMLMELDGMVDYSLVRAENDTVIVGVERGAGVAFVTVVDREIARTDKGLGVGAKLDDLAETLGPRRRSPGRLFDPRIATFERLPNARFVLDDDAAVAVTVGKRDRPLPVPDGEASAPPDRAPKDPGARSRCGADALRDESEAIVAAARLEPSADAPIQLTFGCLDGNDPLVVATAGDRLAIVTGTADRLRRLRTETVDGLVFAGPIDLGSDGSDEIVVVSQSSSPEGKSWRVDVHRGDARMTRLASRGVYHLAAASVPWIGATLSEVDLLLSFEVEEETLHVGGLLLQRDGDRVKIVAPLISKRLVVRSRGGGGNGDDEEVDAGVPDARPRGGKPDAGVLKRPKR